MKFQVVKNRQIMYIYKHMGSFELVADNTEKKKFWFKLGENFFLSSVVEAPPYYFRAPEKVIQRKDEIQSSIIH